MSAVLQKGKLLKHSNIIFNWRLSQRQYSKAAPTMNTAEERLQSSSKSLFSQVCRAGRCLLHSSTWSFKGKVRRLCSPQLVPREFVATDFDARSQMVDLGIVT